jgi:hypothetical protein
MARKKPEVDLVRIRTEHYTELLSKRADLCDAMRALLFGEKDPVRIAFIRRAVIDAGGNPPPTRVE